MKIVHVHRAFYPVIGGVANYTRSLARETVRLGHDVTVLTSALGAADRPAEEIIDGIKVKRLGYLFRVGGTPVIPRRTAKGHPLRHHLSQRYRRRRIERAHLRRL
jgi:glycosyltransferase involved in cell wall biosynthesis